MEEIIIDGVDVAGCKFLEEAVRYNNNAVCSCTDVRDCEGDLFIECCGEKPNCYYKQLKRLEQENNSLQAQLNNITVQSNNAITALEQENKKLKETKGRCAFKCLDNTFCDEARIKIDKLELDRDCLNVSLETARKYRGIAEVERDKYRSALEEIREKIKSLNKDICNNCGWHNTDNCQPNGYVCHDLIEMKNKINEVLK